MPLQLQPPTRTRTSTALTDYFVNGRWWTTSALDTPKNVGQPTVGHVRHGRLFEFSRRPRPDPCTTATAQPRPAVNSSARRSTAPSPRAPLATGAPWPMLYPMSSLRRPAARYAHPPQPRYMALGARVGEEVRRTPHRRWMRLSESPSGLAPVTHTDEAGHEGRAITLDIAHLQSPREGAMPPRCCTSSSPGWRYHSEPLDITIDLPCAWSLRPGLAGNTTCVMKPYALRSAKPRERGPACPRRRAAGAPPRRHR